jgi:hypothetical protein
MQTETRRRQTQIPRVDLSRRGYRHVSRGELPNVKNEHKGRQERRRRFEKKRDVFCTMVSSCQYLFLDGIELGRLRFQFVICSFSCVFFNSIVADGSCWSAASNHAR